MLVPELVKFTVAPEQKVPPPPAVIVGGVIIDASTAVLGVEIQAPNVAST